MLIFVLTLLLLILQDLIGPLSALLVTDTVTPRPQKNMQLGPYDADDPYDVKRRLSVIKL